MRAASAPDAGLHSDNFVNVTLSSKSSANKSRSVGSAGISIDCNSSTVWRCSDLIGDLLCLIIIEHSYRGDVGDLASLLGDLIDALRPGFKACTTKAPDFRPAIGRSAIQSQQCGGAYGGEQPR